MCTTSFAVCIRGRTPTRFWTAAGSFCSARRRSADQLTPGGAVIVARTATSLRVAAGEGHLQDPRDSGRRQAADDGARVSRRPSVSNPATASARIHDCAGPPGRLRNPFCRLRRPRGSSHRHRHARATRSRDDRDRALAAEIATGVQRQRAALDHLIAHFARRPLDSTRPRGRGNPPPQRLPAAASLPRSGVGGRRRCGEADREAGKRSASGLVNAVLRAISRNRSALPLAGQTAG